MGINKMMTNGIFGLNVFIDIQTSKTLIQMCINKMMTNGIFTMNDEHTQPENKHNRFRIRQVDWYGIKFADNLVKTYNIHTAK